MKFRQSVLRYSAVPAILMVVALGFAVVGHSGGPGSEEEQQKSGPSAASAKEEAYRFNNIGVAELEEYKYEEAAAKFRQALKVDPGLSIAHLNLCIALFN